MPHRLQPAAASPLANKMMRLALRLARRAYGATSPNPMVGAVLAKRGRIIGRGWHHRAGQPHAEVEAIRDARRRGYRTNGATLYVTLEPCSSHGRTPPCTEAIIEAGILESVIGATDPNPKHRGRGFNVLKRAGVSVTPGVLGEECTRLNEAFNHWIVHHTPLVTVKAAMTLDGKIASKTGESKWITGMAARDYGMKLRQGADAIIVGINTILADDPSLTYRGAHKPRADAPRHVLRRFVLDSMARTPLQAKVVSDENAALTTIVVSEAAPRARVARLANRVSVVVARSTKRRPETRERALDLQWLLKKMGSESITSLLVEGGGEVNASFLMSGLAQRVAFFYAPRILGGRDSRRGVAGEGARNWDEILNLDDLEWRRLGDDLLLTARTTNAAVK